MLQNPPTAGLFVIPYRMKKKKLPPLVGVPGKPFMALVNRYMSGATDAEKEEASNNVEWFVKVLVRINERLEQDKQQTMGR